MPKDYPHLDDTVFPNLDNENVYKYRNEFDYSRWTADVRIYIGSVNWDNTYSNVVKFDDDSSRDEWFSKQSFDVYDLQTMFHNMPQTSITLPIPFQDMGRFNYLYVDMPRPTSEGNPIEYADGYRKRYFYFINSIDSKAPNATECQLQMDVWTTYVNGIDISYMMLERGHAPMKKVTPEQYLKNPLKNNRHVLTPDVNFGETEVVRASGNTVINDKVYVYIVHTASIGGEWGSKPNGSIYDKDADDDKDAVWRVPTGAYHITDMNTAYQHIVVALDDFYTLLENADEQAPQWKQTIQAVYLVPEAFVDTETKVVFCGVTVHTKSNTGLREFDLIDLSVDDFGFDGRYRNITKLYTSPYSNVEVTDEKGNKHVVRVEDTVGKLGVNLYTNLVFPSLRIDGYVSGVGGSVESSVTYSTLRNTTKHFKVGGKWYDLPVGWDIPTFQVAQIGADEYDYSTYWNRRQQVNDYKTARDNAEDNASNIKTNARKEADTNNTNAGNTAKNIIDNTKLQTQANTAMVKKANATALKDMSYSQGLNIAIQAWNAGYSHATAARQDMADWETTVANSVTGIVSGIASGVVSGSSSPIGAGVGAIAGAVDGIASAANGVANTFISTNLRDDLVDLGVENSQKQVEESNQNIEDKTKLTAGDDGINLFNKRQQNKVWRNQANNNSNLTIANSDNINGKDGLVYKVADNNYNTSINVANRVRDNSKHAIQNSVRQSKLRKPEVYGVASNCDTAVSKPMMVSANVVTQSDGAIAAAGDAMLRYGYSYGLQWDFDGFNVMDYFTYWKTSEVWIRSYADSDEGVKGSIRDILNNGVTVWRNPDMISAVSIYDNGI